jgi:polyhydroxyalkanoate synthesis regulator phasin
MNTDSLWQSIQTGLRVSLGATASILETLQDPQKREESLVILQAELHDRVQEWVAKGEMTEQEARNFIDSILRQQGSDNSTPANSPEEPGQPDAQQSVEELTDKIADLRSELENLRNADQQK